MKQAKVYYITMRNADGTQYVCNVGWSFDYEDRLLMTEAEAADFVAEQKLCSTYENGDYGIWQLKVWKETAIDVTNDIKLPKLDDRLPLVIVKDADGNICDMFSNLRADSKGFKWCYSIARHNKPAGGSIELTTTERNN